MEAILTCVDTFADDDGTVALKFIVEETQRRLGTHPAFPAWGLVCLPCSLSSRSTTRIPSIATP